MKTLILPKETKCLQFLQCDLGEKTEMEFQDLVIDLLTISYPNFQCVKFSSLCAFEGDNFRPDLALVARNRSHWFVIEVEMHDHSEKFHILPQLRAFRYGTWREDAARSLSKSLDIGLGEAKTLLSKVPRSVAVITNKASVFLENATAAIDVQMIEISYYRAPSDEIIYATDKRLKVIKENLGFGKYFSADSLLRFSKETRIPEGVYQIDDESGTFNSWSAKRSDGFLWLRRENGSASFENGQYVQAIRSWDGGVYLQSSTGSAKKSL